MATKIARQSVAVVLKPTPGTKIARQSVAVVLKPRVTPAGPAVRMLTVNEFDNKML